MLKGVICYDISKIKYCGYSSIIPFTTVSSDKAIINPDSNSLYGMCLLGKISLDM